MIEEIDKIVQFYGKKLTPKGHVLIFKEIDNGIQICRGNNYYDPDQDKGEYDIATICFKNDKYFATWHRRDTGSLIRMPGPKDVKKTFASFVGLCTALDKEIAKY